MVRLETSLYYNVIVVNNKILEYWTGKKLKREKPRISTNWENPDGTPCK
jgi:hypothetical protein